MYYLNTQKDVVNAIVFLRTKFICIIWTSEGWQRIKASSWGLSLFVLFEQQKELNWYDPSSWGLSLFVLFELQGNANYGFTGSWGQSLFVLFELYLRRHKSDMSSWGLSLFVLFEPWHTNPL